MKKIFVFLAATAMSLATFAEDTVVTVKNENVYVAPKSAWFMSLMGGLNHGKTDNLGFRTFENNIGGVGTLEFGYRFNPYISLALDGQYRRVGSFQNSGLYAGLNVMTSTLKMYWDLTNTIGGYKADRKHHFYVYGGFVAGFTYLRELDVVPAFSKHHYSYGFRAGLQYELMLKRNWAFLVDADFGMLTDGMDCNSDPKNKMEQLVDLQVGIRKYFGTQRKTAKYYATESYTNYITRRDTTVVKQVVEVPQTLPIYTCFFTINKIDLNEASQASIKQCADYMKQHSDKKVTVFGYADKNTGTDRRNAWLASNRARVVKEALIAEGISEDRISTFDEGSSVQPFPEAVYEKNRSTIMLISE